MTFRPELIDELLKEYRNPEDLMGEGGIVIAQPREISGYRPFIQCFW